VQNFKFRKIEKNDKIKVTGFADSDWAGSPDSKSTSGGVISIGGCVIKTWSTTQQTISLSSGEAELYAMTKAASQLLGAMSYLADFDIPSEGEVVSDSTAALGIVTREGLGRTRHIRVQYLWLQEASLENRLKVNKVGTKENVADLMTKHLRKEDRDTLLELIKMQTVSVGVREVSKIDHRRAQGE
jgi:hypothetical protein